MPHEIARQDDAEAPPGRAADAEVGARIRALRQARGLRLAEVAARTGLSIGYLSQVERGISSPSLRVLTTLAAPLGVTYADLFRPAAAGAPGDSVVVRRDERNSLGLWRTGIEKQLLSPAAGSRLNLYEVVLEPGGTSGDELYVHGGEEAGLVLEGEMRLTVEDQSWRLRAGDSFRFASSRPHRFDNPGPRVARVVWVNVADPA
ncbi:cupin domain-containing protein [Alsobacter sp. SYSU BS001988]|jgi:transcriptional regulator with XRE-family HTH domain